VTLPLTLHGFTGNAAAWHAVCSLFPERPLVQSWAHGAAREAQGGWSVERCIFKEKSTVVGFAQAMIRPAPLKAGRLVWIARGPVYDSASDPSAGWPQWSQMATLLREKYGSGLGDYLRIAPPFSEDLHAPVPAGFAITPMGGWASAMMDLSVGLDDLKTALKGKWRNGLNKAERVGVVVSNHRDAGSVDAFADAHDTFMAGIGADGSVTGAYIKALHRAQGDGSDLTVFNAEYEGAIAGRLLTCRTGDRVEYLASHMTDAGKKASAGQALLWAAVADAHSGGAPENGAKWFDVGGMDPDRTPKGIFDFKDGLRGSTYRLMPEIDCCGGPLARLIKSHTDAARAKMGA